VAAPRQTPGRRTGRRPPRTHQHHSPARVPRRTP
jgi:hypothetical protein